MSYDKLIGNEIKEFFMKIWKIAHGNSFFDDATHKKYINNQVISMHPNTAPKGQSSKSQGENFTSQDRCLNIFSLFRAIN